MPPPPREYAGSLRAGAPSSRPPANTRHASGLPNRWPQTRQIGALRRKRSLTFLWTSSFFSQAPCFRERLIVESWWFQTTSEDLVSETQQLPPLEPLSEDIECLAKVPVAAGGLPFAILLPNRLEAKVDFGPEDFSSAARGGGGREPGARGGRGAGRLLWFFLRPPRPPP